MAAAALGRPIAACVVVAGTALIGAGIIVAVPGGASAGEADAAAAYRPDVASLLDMRSPGGRRYSWLVDTKPDRDADGPVERVLSSVRRRSPAAADRNLPVGDPVVGAALIPDATGLDVTSAVDPGAALVAAAGGSPISIGGIGGGGIIGGPGGGGPGGGGGDDGVSDPVPTPTPVAPVPEATTWAMMLMGFALLGVTVRLRGSALARAR